MTCQIIIEKKAQKFILKQRPDDQKRLLSAIARLPFEGDLKAMRGHENLFRLRVGDFRILYTVDHGKLIVCVIGAGNRGDIYKS